MGRELKKLITFVLGMFSIIIIAGIVYYPLNDAFDVNHDELYKVSLVLGGIVVVISYFYINKLHKRLFRKNNDIKV